MAANATILVMDVRVFQKTGGEDTFTLTTYIRSKPGQAVEEAIAGIAEEVGWALRVSPDLKEAQPVTKEELTLLRRFDPKGFFTQNGSTRFLQCYLSFHREGDKPLGLSFQAVSANLQSGAVALASPGIEENKHDFPDRCWLLLKKGNDCPSCCSCCFIGGIAIGSSAYGREGNAGQLVLSRQFQTLVIGAFQELRLVAAAAMPDGTNSVYHIRCFEIPAGGDHSFACGQPSLAGHDFLALL